MFSKDRRTRYFQIGGLMALVGFLMAWIPLPVIPWIGAIICFLGIAFVVLNFLELAGENMREGGHW